MAGRGLPSPPDGVPGRILPDGTAGQVPAIAAPRQADANAAPAWLSADEPAFTTGTAADLLGVRQSFLRQLGTAGLLEPHRSGGGHRRYSRHELDLAARARTLVDEGMPLEAACRIVALEVELAAVRAELAQLRQHGPRDRTGRRSSP
jgi:MerR family transcriptional regulator, heat shock protein HspR